MERELCLAPCFLWSKTTVGMLTSTSHLDCTIRPKLHSIVAHASLLCPFSPANRKGSSTSVRSSDRMHWNMSKMWCDIRPEFPSSTRNLRSQSSRLFHRREYRWVALALCPSIPPIANSPPASFSGSLTLLHRNCLTWPVSIDVFAWSTMVRLVDSSHLQSKWQYLVKFKLQTHWIEWMQFLHNCGSFLSSTSGIDLFGGGLSIFGRSFG